MHYKLRSPTDEDSIKISEELPHILIDPRESNKEYSTWVSSVTKMRASNIPKLRPQLSNAQMYTKALTGASGEVFPSCANSGCKNETEHQAQKKAFYVNNTSHATSLKDFTNLNIPKLILDVRSREQEHCSKSTHKAFKGMSKSH